MVTKRGPHQNFRRTLKDYDLAIVEPPIKHYYQPLWTLVGAGVFPKEKSERAESVSISKGEDWIQDAVAELHPDENFVVTKSGRRIGYDCLVTRPEFDLSDSRGTSYRQV